MRRARGRILMKQWEEIARRLRPVGLPGPPTRWGLKIADVKARAIAREAKQDPEAKPFIAAVRAIDKAMVAATNEETTRALEAARVPLSTRLVEMGLRLPNRKAAAVA